MMLLLSALGAAVLCLVLAAGVFWAFSNIQINGDR